MAYFITIKQGNLLDETADFIVNASNTKLILGSGVSMSFKRKCGYELQKLMNKELILRKKLQKGDVVLTSSANAENFKYALHVAVMDYNDRVKGNDRNPTLEDIKKGLQNIEQLIQKFAFKEKKKIAIPLLGCGVGGLDKSEVIKLYKESFQKTVEFDCEVVIYGYDEEDFELLKKYLLTSHLH